MILYNVLILIKNVTNSVEDIFYILPRLPSSQGVSLFSSLRIFRITRFFTKVQIVVFYHWAFAAFRHVHFTIYDFNCLAACFTSVCYLFFHFILLLCGKILCNCYWTIPKFNFKLLHQVSQYRTISAKYNPNILK